VESAEVPGHEPMLAPASTEGASAPGAAKTPIVVGPIALTPPPIPTPAPASIHWPPQDPVDDNPATVRGHLGVILGVLVLVAVLVGALVWWKWPSHEITASAALAQASSAPFQMKSDLITS